MSTALEQVCDDLFFPEGPVALADGSVIFVEIGRRCISRVYPGGRKVVVAEPGGGPNGAAVGPDGALYVCNNGGLKMHREPGLTRTLGQSDDYSGGRIERVDLRTGKTEVLYTSCGGIPLKSPNDLVFDRHGGFYFTDVGKTRPRDRDRGGIYYALPDGSSIREVVFPLSHPNGVGLSPDETELYTAETETARLWKFRITEPGHVALLPYPESPNGGEIMFGAGGFQRFDSLKVEQNGNVCVGTLHNGGITVVPPAGGAVQHVPLPDLLPTNLCFGGADQRDVYVTFSSSGRMVKLRWPRPGLKLHFLDRVA